MRLIPEQRILVPERVGVLVVLDVLLLIVLLVVLHLQGLEGIDRPHSRSERPIIIIVRVRDDVDDRQGGVQSKRAAFAKISIACSKLARVVMLRTAQSLLTRSAISCSLATCLGFSGSKNRAFSKAWVSLQG